MVLFRRKKGVPEEPVQLVPVPDRPAAEAGFAAVYPGGIVNLSRLAKPHQMESIVVTSGADRHTYERHATYKLSLSARAGTAQQLPISSDWEVNGWNQREAHPVPGRFSPIRHEGGMEEGNDTWYDARPELIRIDFSHIPEEITVIEIAASPYVVTPTAEEAFVRVNTWADGPDLIRCPLGVVSELGVTARFRFAREDDNWLFAALLAEGYDFGYRRLPV